MISIADFAGGGLLCAFGILAAIVERNRSGKGQVIDCSMTEGAAYVASWITRSQYLPIWFGERGENILDGGSFFYGTYETSDGKYMSVGALEPQFYQAFVDALGLSDFDQFNATSDEHRNVVKRIFKSKTQQEWSDIFEEIDACVFPVVDWKNADQHPHNKERKTFVSKQLTNDAVVPNPAPILSRTPAISGYEKTQTDDYNQGIEEILEEIGVTASDIRKLEKDGALFLSTTSSKL